MRREESGADRAAAAVRVEIKVAEYLVELLPGRFWRPSCTRPYGWREKQVERISENRENILRECMIKDLREIIYIFNWDGICMTPQSFPIWKLSNAWISTAEMLKRSADRLLSNYQLAYQELSRQTSQAIASGERTRITMPQDLDLYCPYMLLMGYAIENLIKGAIICGTGLSDPNFGGAVNFEEFRAINRENGAPWTVDQHGFINLLKVTAIRADLFNDDEKEVLKYLDIIIKWGGRYPVPKRQESGGSSGFVCAEPPYIGSRDTLPIPAVNSIYEKALEEMRRVCSQYQAVD